MFPCVLHVPLVLLVGWIGQVILFHDLVLQDPSFSARLVQRRSRDSKGKEKSILEMMGPGDRVLLDDDDDEMKYDEHPRTDCHYDFNGWHFRNSRSDVVFFFFPLRSFGTLRIPYLRALISVAEIIPKFQKICVRSGAPDVWSSSSCQDRWKPRTEPKALGPRPAAGSAGSMCHLTNF